MSDSKGTGTNSLFLPLRRSFTLNRIKIFSIKSGNKKNKFCSGTFCLKSSNDFCKIFRAALRFPFFIKPNNNFSKNQSCLLLITIFFKRC